MAVAKRISWFLLGVSIVVVLALLRAAQAQISLSELGTPVTEDFAGYTGSGAVPHSPTPTPFVEMMLDTNSFAVSGMSDGNLPFGSTVTSGDYARGTTAGGETVGGMYAFDLGATNRALGFQPTEDDMTPGVLLAKIVNSTGTTIDHLTLSYELVVLNDEPRSTSWRLSWATDQTGPFTAVSAVDFQTPEPADAVPTYETSSFGTVLTGFTLNDGDALYLRWQTDDVSGSGARDEIGIDTIVVTGYQTIFDDGFENGSTSAWSTTVGGLSAF